MRQKGKKKGEESWRRKEGTLKEAQEDIPEREIDPMVEKRKEETNPEEMTNITQEVTDIKIQGMIEITGEKKERITTEKEESEGQDIRGDLLPTISNNRIQVMRVVIAIGGIIMDAL